MANPSRAWLTQPLPYFLALGAAIFVVDAYFSSADHGIVVSQEVRAEVAAKTQLELGRVPQPQELAAALEEWKENEALYREGLSMGLLENDDFIRTHIANKLRYVASERTIIAEPSEAKLRAYLQSHAERFTQPASFDIDHVFVSQSVQGQPTGIALTARARAEGVLEEVTRGAAWKTAGDHFPRGPQFTDKSQSELERVLKVELSSVLDPPRVQAWTMVEGKRGFHLIRVTRVRGGLPSFERLKATLRLAVIAEEKERAAQRYVDEVQSRYEFEVEP